jgi:hypothetical protein
MIGFQREYAHLLPDCIPFVDFGLLAGRVAWDAGFGAAGGAAFPNYVFVEGRKLSGLLVGHSSLLPRRCRMRLHAHRG